MRTIHRLAILSSLAVAACAGNANNSLPDATVVISAPCESVVCSGTTPICVNQAGMAVCVCDATSCPTGVPCVNGACLVSSRAYKGHLDERDTTNFVDAYPAAVGSRLDDCQTCHKSATLTNASGKSVTKNTCDFCHLIQHPDSSLTGQPTKYSDTLNPFGADYNAAGRTVAGLQSIDGTDSDGDSFANGVEIAALKYPGDPASKPGQPNAPQKILTLADLNAAPAQTEFLLANSNKQQYDYYASYTGVTLKDLLTAVGVSPTDPNVTGVTVIAPDGFLKDESIADINKKFPQGMFYAGLDTATLGTACGFVQYPNQIPSGVADHGPIPGDQYLQIAYLRDGAPMDPSNLDPTSGTINGEGPYRLIVPQSTPGAPDWGSGITYPAQCDEAYKYNSSADHNAGSMVRGVIAVRINPLPAGVEDFDYRNGGWAYIVNSTIIVYGYGIQ
jgi:hypothetical protein